jgi:Ca2+-binding EF-hand superfamily protein
MNNVKKINRVSLQSSENQVAIPFEVDNDVIFIELKHKENVCLKSVFNLLLDLEEENTSDEEPGITKYLKHIENKVPATKDSSFNLLTHPALSHPDSNGEVVKEKTDKISAKALRKMLKKLTSQIRLNKEEIDLMIWEIDEDMDGKISYYELEKMYKRCITDTEELEPKRLFYLVQFLMFDKDLKLYITEEDSLELLYLRHQNKLNSAIDDIFKVVINDSQGNEKKVIKDKIYYEEYLKRMIDLALRKRAEVKGKRKNYCELIYKEKI